MTHAEAVLSHEELYILAEPQQPDEVGYRGSILAGSLADLFVAEAVLACQSVQGLSHFDWIQIFALNVFDERNFKESVVGEFPDDDRYLVKPASRAARHRRSPATS